MDERSGNFRSTGQTWISATTSHLFIFHKPRHSTHSWKPENPFKTLSRELMKPNKIYQSNKQAAISNHWDTNWLQAEGSNLWLLILGLCIPDVSDGFSEEGKRATHSLPSVLHPLQPRCCIPARVTKGRQICTFPSTIASVVKTWLYPIPCVKPQNRSIPDWQAPNFISSSLAQAADSRPLTRLPSPNTNREPQLIPHLPHWHAAHFFPPPAMRNISRT